MEAKRWVAFLCLALLLAKVKTDCSSTLAFIEKTGATCSNGTWTISGSVTVPGGQDFDIEFETVIVQEEFILSSNAALKLQASFSSQQNIWGSLSCNSSDIGKGNLKVGFFFNQSSQPENPIVSGSVFESAAVISEYFAAYDPAYTTSTCVQGQLFYLENGLTFVYLNTTVDYSNCLSPSEGNLGNKHRNWLIPVLVIIGVVGKFTLCTSNSKVFHFILYSHIVLDWSICILEVLVRSIYTIKIL